MPGFGSYFSNMSGEQAVTTPLENVPAYVETVKKNSAFTALVTQLGAKLETMSDVELRTWLEEQGRRFLPFRSFVISNEEPLRKIATSTSELKWMLRYIDFVVGKER